MIDPRALVDPAARLAKDVEVGPFTIIGPEVEIAAGTWVGPHVVIKGPTRVGRDNRIYQFASIGDVPQDKKYGGERTFLEIGDRNTIREYVTINRGTVQDAGVTRVGHDNWIMAYVHIAHDCQIGNDTVFANGASLAGHVKVDHFSILSGFTLVHQFCSIGAHSFCGMGSAITKDVPPYMTVSGNPVQLHGVNSEGLRRHDFSPEAIQALRRAHKLLFRSNLTLKEAATQLHDLALEQPDVGVLIAFLEGSQRGFIR